MKPFKSNCAILLVRPLAEEVFSSSKDLVRAVVELWSHEWCTMYVSECTAAI